MIEKFDFISMVRNADPQMKFNEKFITYTKEYHGQQRPTEASINQAFIQLFCERNRFSNFIHLFVCLFF